MTNEAPPGPEAEAGMDARAARLVLETFRKQLVDLLEEVNDGTTAHARKLVPIVTDLAKAVAKITDEGSKLDAERRGRERSRGPDAQEPALDLDAARDEVRRRLARLRSAG